MTWPVPDRENGKLQGPHDAGKSYGLIDTGGRIGHVMTCARETKIRGHERRAGKEAASAGISGEGGIVLDVMWVEVGGKRHRVQEGLDWLKLRVVHVRSFDWIQ